MSEDRFLVLGDACQAEVVVTKIKTKEELEKEELAKKAKLLNDKNSTD